MNNRLEEYIEYHNLMYDIGDIDPSYSMLKYLCKRFQLNEEQKYWLAYLYGTNYCGATTYYIYNEFPDYEGVDSGRMQRWWNKNKLKTIFQTDRKWIKNNDLFVSTYESYRKVLRGMLQEEKYVTLKDGSAITTYKNCFKEFGKIDNFGRFALFIYLEAVHVVTDYYMKPDVLDLRDAETCRNGLCLALGFDIYTYYIKGSKGSGYLRLNYQIKAKYFNEMKSLCDKIGLRFYVSDAHHKHLCHGGSCCGLPNTWNYSRGQYTEALKIAQENGKVFFKDIEKELEMFKKFSWVSAAGFNTTTVEKAIERRNHTMYDYLKDTWNTPNSAKSPYKYFGGVLKPIGLDESNNVIYQYDGESL